MPTLNFKGKTAVESYHLVVPHHILDFDEKLSLTDSPSLDGNLIIEGDNLLALKALLPTHAGKVKCIYIDPPYNTGNEGWIYNDNLTQPQFKEWIGQVVGKEGEDACRHDKWCCMMYPRLQLFKDLLRDDGAVFVSIDDNEVHHLRMLMDEIFGECNFIACIANVNNPKGRSDDKNVATAHEYLLVYQKAHATIGGWPPEDNVLRRYNKKDASGNKYREIDLRKTGDNDRRQDRENLFYYFMHNPNTKDFYATRDPAERPGFVRIVPIREDGSEGNWRWGLETANEKRDILVPKYMPVRKKWSVFEMDYLGPNERVKPTSAWTMKDVNSERGTEQFLELGFSKEEFPRPKPVGLLMRIVQLATTPNSGDIVLDSFAGSGTTAQAVMQQNATDGGNRCFVLVQMPHETKEQEARRFNICARLTRERAARVAHGHTHVTPAGGTVAVNALGGQFTYCRLGKMLFDRFRNFPNGEYPSYEELAKYIFYTETSRALDVAGIDYDTGRIGEHAGRSYYLLYTPDGNADRALTMDWLAKTSGRDPRPKVVYCEKIHVHRRDLAGYGNVRAMQVPFNLK
ncbi:MAG: site-specific DNA-methyltransferase [Armatimonadota bacterium]|nr:site-specific DNA-methyltransferase [Armatimonadota bacterium]